MNCTNKNTQEFIQLDSLTEIKECPISIKGDKIQTTLLILKADDGEIVLSNQDREKLNAYFLKGKPNYEDLTKKVE